MVHSALTSCFFWLKSLGVLGLLCIYNFLFCCAAFAQPANDNCLTAEPIIIPASGTICVNYSSVAATTSSTTNACNTVVVNEVWFTFITAGPANTVTVTPTGGTPIQQPVVTISDGTCAATTFNTCDAAATAGGAASANWAYAPGTQVNVSVAGILGDGTFEICITSETPPPTPGGSCGGATPTCDPSPFTLASSAGNPSSGISPSCFNILGAPQIVQNDMWFVFTAGQSGSLEFMADLNGIAEFDWAIYNITSGCPGVEVTCNYFYSNGNSGMIGLQNPAGGEFNAPINVVAGSTYGIMIDNYDNNGVGFDFTWGGTFQMAPTADFTVNTPSGCNSLTTTFTNTTVGASTYDWDFGNGSTSTAQNPTAQNYPAPGTYFVTLEAISGAGCSNSFSGSIEVFDDPTLTFTETDESCAGACDGQLVANTSGTGPFNYIWTGLPGTTNTQSSLCANTYNVSVTDQSNGCTATEIATVASGGASLDATITPIGPYCPADASVNLTAVDAGGTWSGTGITNAALGTFDPAVAGIGTWTITYTIAGACGDTQTEDIIVTNVVDATVTSAGPFCLGNGLVNLTAATVGGTWSGNGIIDVNTGTFDPSVAGIGAWNITYTIAGPCGSSDSETIVVSPNTDATITPVGPFCNSESATNLVGLTPGGTWSGTGITDPALGTFNPAIAGIGTWTITYTIPGSCGDIQTTDIQVGEITFTQAVTDATCFGTASGAIEILNQTGSAAHQFSINNGTSFQAANLFQNVPAGDHLLVVEDANGCQSTPALVTIGEPLEIVLVTNLDQESNCGNADGIATVVAIGGTVAVDYQYSWNSPAPQLTNAATGLLPGTVTVIVTDDNSCTETADVVVTSTAGFTASINASIDATCFDLCDGEATAIADILATGPVSYAWSGPGVQTTATATGLCAGDYTVTIMDAVGCMATATATILEPTEVLVGINPTDVTVCIGGSSTLNTAVSGGTSPYSNYTWTATPLDPILVTTDQNPTVFPSVETTYSVVAEDANGCVSNQVDVTIDLSSPLTLDVSRPIATDTTICSGDSVTLNLQTTGGNGVYSYFLQPGLNPISLPLMVQPILTNTYDFMVSDGCSTPPANATATITVIPVAIVDFEAPEPDGCAPFIALFNDLTTPEPINWEWDFGDPDSGNNTSNDQNPSHLYSEPGNYDVSLSVTSTEGCVSEIAYSGLIETFSTPTASFETDTNQANVLNATFNFTDFSSGDVSTWDWDFGDGNFSTEQNPTHTYLDTGRIFVTLTVFSTHGCSSSAIDRIYVSPILTFYVPNAFTPDRDQLNDGFRAYGEGYDWSNYQMSVFNRWGQRMFQTNKIEDGWQGTFKNNEIKTGVYTWQVQVADFNGRLYPFSGFVTLIRQSENMSLYPCIYVCAVNTLLD